MIESKMDLRTWADLQTCFVQVPRPKFDIDWPRPVYGIGPVERILLEHIRLEMDLDKWFARTIMRAFDVVPAQPRYDGKLYFAYGTIPAPPWARTRATSLVHRIRQDLRFRFSIVDCLLTLIGGCEEGQWATPRDLLLMWTPARQSSARITRFALKGRILQYLWKALRRAWSGAPSL